MTPPTSEERRGFPRLWAGEQVTLESAGATAHGRIADISASGVAVETDAAWPLGSEVSVKFADMAPFRAQVVRAAPGQLALIFADGPHYLFR